MTGAVGGALSSRVLAEQREELAGLLPLQDAADEHDVTYRQVHHWVATGLLRAKLFDQGGHTHDVRHRAGQGYRFFMTPEEVAVLGVMARLVRAGVAPRVAAALARTWGAGSDTLQLGPGLLLSVAAQRYAPPEREERSGA